MRKSLVLGTATAAVALLLNLPASAQVSLQTTPPPTVTAENEPWYSSGGPVVFGGGVYYPAGAVIHFLRNEMVRTGTIGNVPVYARTTQETGSMIYVPLAGGVMKPYERRRSGDLAGTVGSTAPSFRVVLPAEEAPQVMVSGLEAPSPGPEPTPVGTTGFVPAPTTSPAATDAATAATPANVGTAGIVVDTPARAVPTRIQTARRPVGLNTVFVDFQNMRWYAGGATVEYTPSRFTRIGEHRGFGVYQENGRTGTIFLSLVDGAPGLLAPYKSR